MARRHGQGRRAAFKRCDTLLQNRAGRIADPGIDVAEGLEAEQRGGMIHVIEDEETWSGRSESLGRPSPHRARRLHGRQCTGTPGKRSAWHLSGVSDEIVLFKERIVRPSRSHYFGRFRLNF